MKIAHLATIDVGVKYLLLNQLKTIQAAGHEVHAICRNGPLVPEIQQTGIPVHTVAFERKITPFRDMQALFELYQLLRREKFDLIHTHTPKASLIGQWAAKIARVPRRVHTIHGLYLPQHASRRKQQFWAIIEKITMRPPHLILSQSREDITTAIEKRLAMPQKLLYLGNGIDLRRFNLDSISEHDQIAVRSELNIPHDRVIIGIVGRLVAEKGFFEFFEAAHLVSQQFPNCTFLCIGPDEPDKADGVSLVDKHKAQQTADIRFLGMRADLPQLYSIMTLLVHPSYREGFPRVPMEAAAMKVPMIVTNIRGCREIVTHEVNGLLIPPQDPKALVDAIIRLLCNPDEAKHFAVEARRKAVVEFDEHIIFQRILNTYSQL